MKKFLALLLALAMALSLAACGGEAGTSQPPAQSQQAEANTPGPAQTTEPPAEPTQQAGGAAADLYLQKANEVKVTDDAVIFTDDSGRGELTIAKEPQNVAVLYGSLAALWYEAGGTIQLAIGGKSAVDLYNEQIGRDFTQDEGVTIVSESSSGTNWDVEAILATKPDLIVCSTGMKGYETIGGPAEAVGIPVIAINYNSVQDYLKWFKVFCNLVGRPDLWDTVANSTVQNIASIVSSVPKNQKALSCVVLNVNSGTMKAYTNSSEVGAIIVELGGANVADPDGTAKGSSLDVSLEDLYNLDPDIVFLCEVGDPGESRELLEQMTKDNPVWQEIRAIKEGRLLYLEKSLYRNKPNHLYDLAYQKMAQYLYPDQEF